MSTYMTKEANSIKSQNLSCANFMSQIFNYGRVVSKFHLHHGEKRESSIEFPSKRLTKATSRAKGPRVSWSIIKIAKVGGTGFMFSNEACISFAYLTFLYHRNVCTRVILCFRHFGQNDRIAAN